MKEYLVGAAAILVSGAALTAGAIFGGFVDVAADSPHGDSILRLIDLARERAISRQAAAIIRPANLSDADRIRRGAGNYDAMCVDCHLKPAVEDSEIRKGLYPKPPNLVRASVATDMSDVDAERFWIIKHGIKASGMAAWSKAGMADDQIWDLVAFVKVLPTLSADEYQRWVEKSEGHSHGGIEAHHHPDDVPEQGHDHGGHRHLDSHHAEGDSR